MKLKNFFNLTIRVRDFNLVAHEPALVKQLRKLTLHPYSGLNRELTQLTKLMEHRPVKAQILLAYRQEKIGVNPKLVGWALFSREESDMRFSNTWETYKPTDGILFEVYIHPNHRRQGIASELLKIARRKAGPSRLCVAPWDEQSQKFYNNFAHYGTKWL